MSRDMWIGVVIGIGALIGVLAGLNNRPQMPPRPGAESREVSVLVDVHVAGMVASPGVVQVPEGAIVADAVRAAGGLLPGAATDLVNLAGPVRDGDQVIIPGPAETHVDADGGLISLNRATTAELESLPGVGPVLAARIASHREQKGPFSQVEDLLEVPGIGESKLGSIRDLVRVP